MAEALLPRILFCFGIGFLAANLRLAFQLIRWLRMRSSALLTWLARRPPFYGMALALGVTLGVLIFVKLVVQQRPPAHVFGESMMFVYYGYLLPMTVRIGRGFYADGVWADNQFVPYSEIGRLAWKEGDEVTLLVIPRMKELAARLVVPTPFYGAARRLLRDKVAEHDILLSGSPLDLGVRDEREDI